MKTFLKKTEVSLINGGYLSNKENTPVDNKAFVDAQRRAEYIITFAEMAKGKDFKGSEAISLEDFRVSVHNKLNSAEIIEFVAVPKKPLTSVTNKLKGEALAFINFKIENDKAEKINIFLNQFAIINEFETFGLFFEQDIVKLNKIYTMSELVTAVNSVIDLLG